ncbi:MAG: helicase-exonuclease AddAB subunit AddA [Ruminococcus sp.]|nr:helicase-exonuclease AddAB subunit AddA [Candidatus Copronaster equi]
MPEWTTEQKNAIDSRNGTILVSAAAGSGKTAVLVERVIQRLKDEKNPCSADSLLIVTFTRAATQQMKERIYETLSNELAKQPDNAHLRRQLTMLPFAHISTIDSFCNDIVRENFHEIDLTPDYRLLEGAQLKILQSDVMSKLMGELYKENSDEFTELVNVLANSTDDSAVSNLIFSLYSYSSAFANPEMWLDGLLEEYEEYTSLDSGKWGILIKAHTIQMIDHCLKICKKIEECAINDETVREKLSDNIFEITSTVDKISDLLENGTWDEIRNCLLDTKFSNIKAIRGYSSYEFDFIKSAKKEISEIIKKAAVNFCASEKENVEDMEYLYPIVKKLISAVKRYGEMLKEEKIKLNSFDFSDISHYALDLLVSFDETGNIKKTDLAENISQKYAEILVDEFQDINDMQNQLFNAISRNGENLFMVGDVKQSIYRFRQAMPEIFLSRRENLNEYKNENYPAKITLGRNFRSRSGVTDIINFVFSQLMQKELGSIVYDESEALVASADFNKPDFPQAELHIIGNLDSAKVNREIEAQHIADTINDIINKRMQVKDKNCYRNATYRDFCILLRSASGRAEKYADILTKNNIPVYISDKTGFFACAEISNAINLIRIIDNPIQDIPLLAVMLSPIFGFTADEMALLRIDERKLPIYHCVLKAAKNGNKKCMAFLDKLEELRMLSSTLPCSQFIHEMYEITGSKAIAYAMKNGSQRNSNLNKLIEYAEKYESTGKRGISGFIRFIDKIQKQNADLESAVDNSETANVVRIMTIHKSKGLEFPICILADTSAKFFDETKNTASFHPDYGICFDIRDSRRKCKYPTVGKKALSIAEKKSSYSEELRVLYVALTRAKERLICVARYDNIDKRLNELAKSLSVNNNITPYMLLSKNSFSDWLLMAFLRHPDAHLLRNTAGYTDLPSLKSDASLTVKIIDSITFPEEKESLSVKASADDKLLDEIKKRIEYKYPYEELKNIKAKSAPSEFENTDFDTKYFAKTKPSFLSKTGMNPAQRGTAMHKFMEFFDYSSDDYSIDFQLEKMLENNHLTEDESNVLEKDKLERFFSSEIAKRIKNSPLLLREKKVTVGIKAGKLYPDLPENIKDETVVIQGFVDCAFEENGKLVIVDYKTDRNASAETLRERYYNQLKMYEYALHECTGMEIECTLIYSFDNGEYVKL